MGILWWISKLKVGVHTAHRKEEHPKWEGMAGDDDDDDDDDARQVSFTQGTVLSPWTGEMKLEIQIWRPEA